MTYHHKPLAKAWLDETERRMSLISRRHQNDGATIKSFTYYHGDAAVRGSDGVEELLFLHEGSSLKRDVSAFLNRLSPDIITELLNGYRMAKEAGLIDRAMDDIRIRREAFEAKHAASLLRNKEG